MDEELFALKWNNHQSTFLRIIKSLRCKNTYTDATLACNGKFFPAHKIVLSTCSDYFGDIFHQTTCQNPVIVLKDVDCKNLEYLLDYMYVGEINVKQNELASLVSVAECLKIKGLAVPDEPGNLQSSDIKQLHNKNSSRLEMQKGSSELNFSNTDNEDICQSEKIENTVTAISDDILFHNVKVEHDESILLESEIENEEKMVNLNPVNFTDEETDDLTKSKYLCNETLTEENIRRFMNFAGPSQSFFNFHDKNWESDQLGATNEEFSTQLLNSEVHTNFPVHLISENLNSSKTTGLKRLRRKFNFKRNTMGTTSKSSYSCPHCSYSCSDKSNFKRHVQVHTGEKPYHCPFCRYSCIHSSNLKTHIRNKHASDLTDNSLGKYLSLKTQFGSGVSSITVNNSPLVPLKTASL